MNAAKELKTNPNNLKERGIILYGASISTSEWIGLGKEKDFASDLFHLEIMVEILFNSTFRKSLTALFPPYLEYVAKSHEDIVKSLLRDAFNFNGTVEDSLNKLVQLFNEFGIDMYFHENFTDEKFSKLQNPSSINKEQIKSIIKKLIK